MQTDNWKGIWVLAVLVVLVAGYLFLVRAPQKEREAPASAGQKTETPSARVGAPPAPASSGVIVATRSSRELGDYLTDGSGMTLYIFGGDVSGKSFCYDNCAATWPPFFSGGQGLKSSNDELTKRLKVIKRSDGKEQSLRAARLIEP